MTQYRNNSKSNRKSVVIEAKSTPVTHLYMAAHSPVFVEARKKVAGSN